MKRRLAILVGGLVVVGALLVGAWQVAYAQGQAAGREAVMTARTEFVQSRTGGGAATGQPGGQPGGGDGGAAATPGKPGFGAGKPGGGAGTPGAGQGGGNRQGPVVGTVESVQGSTLTLTTDGGPVTVTLGDQTQIRKQVAATASDLKPGERLIVGGARTADGGITAATIQIQGQ